MDAKQIIRELMRITDMSQEKLAKACGMAAQTNVTGILNRGTSLRVDKLMQLIAPMGYKLVIVPDEFDVKDGEFEVTMPLADDGDAE